jgi:hypothetical protein
MSASQNTELTAPPSAHRADSAGVPSALNIDWLARTPPIVSSPVTTRSIYGKSEQVMGLVELSGRRLLMTTFMDFHDDLINLSLLISC